MSDQEPTPGETGDTDESDDQMTDRMADELAPRPEPQIEPGEPNPGGADAVDETMEYDPVPDEPVARDLDPEENPAVEDALPDEMRQGEDTDTEATKTGGRDDVAPEEEPPA